MKILYISTPSYTDTDVPLLKSLIAAGNDIIYLISIYGRVNSTLISLDDHHDKVGIYKWTDYKELGFITSYVRTDNVYVISRKNRKSLSEAMTVCSLLQRIVDEQNPDVIHQIDLPYINMLPFLIRNRRRYVLTIHDPIPHVGESSWKLSLSRRIIFPFIKKIIILNDVARDRFVKMYCLPNKKVYVSRLGFLDWMNQFVSDKVKKDYILFYGRISPYKGVEYLLQSMETVHSSFPNTKLIVAGKGDFYFDISRYKASDYISFINRYIELDELSNLIYNSRFVVCPYIEATQSGVVASVLALGTPIIVTRVGALPDMVEDNVTGIIIPPKDTEALTNVITRLLSDDSLLDSMKNAICSQKKQGNYSWDSIAVLTENIYKA